MSARLSARCPQCESALSFTPEEAQSPIRCGKCGRSFQIRSAAPRPQPTAPAPVAPAPVSPAPVAPAPILPVAASQVPPRSVDGSSPPLLDGLSSNIGIEWPSAAAAPPLSVAVQAAAAPAAEGPKSNAGLVIAGLAAMLSVSLVGTLVLAYLVISGGRGPAEVAQKPPPVASTATSSSSAAGTGNAPASSSASNASSTAATSATTAASTPPPATAPATALGLAPPAPPTGAFGGPGKVPPLPAKRPPEGRPQATPVPPRSPEPAEAVVVAREDVDPSAPTIVKLPAAVEDSCVGGGGRYFILNLASVRQLAVFDVQAGKVVKYLPLAADNVRITAGREKLYVFYVEQASVARFDLATLEKEKTLKLPFSGQVRTAVMGSASAGPILTTYAGSHEALDRVGMCFLNGDTLKEVDLEGARGGDESVRDAMHYRAAPDGRSFGRWCTSHSQSLDLFTLTDQAVKFRSEYRSAGQVLPAGNGYLVCGGGIFTEELKPVGRPDNPAYRLRVPAQGGLFYISCPGGGGAQVNTGVNAGKPTSVRMIGDGRELAVLKNVQLPVGNEAWGGGDFTQDKRVLFSPQAKSVVLIPNDGEPRLLVHAFDLDAALDASGVDYLFAVSSPQPAKGGAPYSYPIVVKSKKGGLKYTLDAGPEGMKVSSTGVVSWTPPARFDEPESVVVTISDAVGQEMFHTFRVVPAAGGPDAVASVPAAPPATVEPVKPDAAPAPELPSPADGSKPAPVPPDAGKPEEAMEAVETEDGAEPQGAVGDLKIKPSVAVDGQIVKLPAVADDVCYAGGGRFLLLRMPSTRQIAVLDFVLGKIVKYVPMTEDGALMAGGLRKFYVVSPSANVFQRWDLKTLEKEATSKNPVPIDVKQVLMGCATDGPMFVAGSSGGRTRGGGWGFIDPRTMKPVDLEGGGNASHRLSEIGSDVDRGTRIRGSADGKVYAFWNQGTSPSGLNTIVVGKSSVKFYNEHDSYGSLLPGPTGTVFTYRGVFTPELKPIGARKGLAGTLPPVPAVEGPWYVSVSAPESAARGPSMGDDGPALKATIRLPAEERVQIALPPFKGMVARNYDYNYRQDGTGGLPFYDRIHLVPSAEILALIPAVGDHVVLHKVDIRGGLDAGGDDYLMVVSRPPSTAVRRTRFRYTPEVWSKKKGVKLKLDSGPPGMRISNGAVDWDVPAKFTEKEVNVLLLVSDASGQETFHTFPLTIVDAVPAASKK